MERKQGFMKKINKTCKECGGACCKYMTIPLDEGDVAEDTDWYRARGELIDGGFWRVPSRCPKLTVEGACSIEADKPATCRAYEVGGEGCRAIRRLKGV